MNSTLKPRDTWVKTTQGDLFSRIWPRSGSETELRAETPIVLFHDSLGSVELWRSFPQNLSLATGRTVVAYDRLGFGKSEPFKGEWTTDFIRDEARTFFPILREQLGIETFIALGHSVGGAMAALCAAAYPAACRALITESAQAFVEARTIQGILEAKAAFQQDGQLERLALYHGDKAAWVLEAWTETWLSPQFNDWNLDEALSKVVCPALILHGEKDEFGSADHPKRLAQAISGETQVEVLPGYRHVPHRENETVILELVATFLSRTLPESPWPTR